MMINEKCFAPLRWALMRSGKNFYSFKKKKKEKKAAAEGGVRGLCSYLHAACTLQASSPRPSAPAGSGQGGANG